jgi:hypothetical protein
MALNQMNEHFNDAFEVYFPTQGPVVRTAHRAAGFLVTNALRFRNRLFQGELLVNERIVEYPVVFKWDQGDGPGARHRVCVIQAAHPARQPRI